MAEFRVLLDSCVMFPMYLRDTLLSTAEAGLYLPYWSQKILDDTIRNLVGTGKATLEKAMKLETIIKAFPEAMVEVPIGLAEVMSNHPGDRHVLAAAVTARADVIVTSNLKHFRSQDLVRWNVEAKSPDTFLSDLYDDDPDSLVQVVRRQSQALQKPPMTITQLLDLLSDKAGVPEFTSKIRSRECGNDVVQIAQKVLSMFGQATSEGGQCFEGERYRLWQQGTTIVITAKDNRGEILRCQNGQIEGNLSSEDVTTFKIYQQRLEQELAADKVQHQKLNNVPLEPE